MMIKAQHIKFPPTLLLLVLLCCVPSLNAKTIRASQIKATTDLKSIHHRGFQASSIEQITDGIMSDTPPYGGFIAHTQSGVIHLALDKAYDLEAFYLWNDIDNRAGHGVKEFSLEFFDASGRLITKISQSKFNGKFVGSTLNIKVEKYRFDEIVRDVKSIDLIIHTSYKDEIRIREVAFADTEIDDKANNLECSSPWTQQNWLEHRSLTLHQNDYMWSPDYQGFFNEKIVQFLHDNTTTDINAETFTQINSYSIQNTNDLPVKNFIKDRWLERWNKKGLTPTPSGGYISKYNQWMKYSSSVSVSNEKGVTLSFFSHDDCVNTLIYYRIKTTANPNELEMQISDGTKITQTTVMQRPKEVHVDKTEIQTVFFTNDNKKISLIKDSGDLSYKRKEFNADLLEWPLSLDYVLHAKFDDTRANRALLHTFNFNIPNVCTVHTAVFEVKIKNLGQQYNNDVLFFFENGSSLTGIKLWQGDELNHETKILKFNLSRFKTSNYEPIQNILQTLDDGDFSLAIQDDTSVDYVKLDIVLSGDDCDIN